MFRHFLVVAAVVVGAMGSTRASARAGQGTKEAEEPAAEVRHERQWLDVVAVPASSAVPLSGPDGVDAAGYPRRFVDRSALRSLLLNRRFSEMTAVLEQFQAEFEADPRYEERVEDAFSSLGLPHRREIELIDAWILATPGSFAPYLARAAHWANSGQVFRGGKYAHETSAFEFAAMAEAFDRARPDIRRALSLRPGLVEASRIAIQIEILGGSRARARRELEDALARCPACYRVRVDWMWALLPRWGGSLEEMRQFAAKRVDPSNPRHRLLPGWVDMELAHQASKDKKHEEALVALDRACALGDEWAFFLERSLVKLRIGDRDGALRDVERANAIRGGAPGVLLQRARVLAGLERWEEAGRDLLYVLRSEPTSRRAIELHPHVAGSLDSFAWKQWQAGRAEVAVRLYALARDLAPGDEGIAKRTAYVTKMAGKRGAPLGGERAPATPRPN